MKKRLTKSHSAPEGLPRIPNGHTSGQRRRQVDNCKLRHHSASGLIPWNSGRDGESMNMNSRVPHHHDDTTTTRSSLTPFPMVRSSTFDRYSIKPYAQPMLTILQTEYENDPHVAECQVVSEVERELSDISSESELVFRDDLSLERGMPCVARKEKMSGASDTHIDFQNPRPLLGQNKNNRTCTERHSLIHQQNQIRGRRRPPRTPTVSPVSHKRGPDGTSSMLSELLPLGRDHLYPSDHRWDDDTGSDDVPSVVTCPVLTKEVLSSTAMQGHTVHKQDRVFDWLASCDDDVRTASLPPHLPDINGLKRYNTTVA